MNSFIGIGSNVGNRLENLSLAINLIEQRCLRNIKSSIILETDAILPKNAPPDWDKSFLNMIISGETKLLPTELLKSLKDIEREIGRPEKYEKWAPRIIDLDILLYGDQTINNDNLIIPHPEIKNRPFLKHLLALMGVNPEFLEQHIFTKSYVFPPKLVGIINATKDSFSDGGKFYHVQNAAEQMTKLIQDGASIVEIGAQSTRPGAILQSVKEEYAKLDEILQHAMPIVMETNISVDTFHPAIALDLLKKYPIKIINDVKGSFDEQALREIANSGCKFALMHSLNIPVESNNVLSRSFQEDLIKWANNSLNKLTNLGFSAKDIILDPGIGFGKTPYQNIAILKNIEAFKKLGCQIMLGHSRKSYIQAFSIQEAQNRDIETIAISLAVADKVDFLRVHNVKDHMRAMVSNYLVKEER